MKIEDYQFGRIQIDGETYTSDVLVWPGNVDDSWWRKEGHNLCLEDLKGLLDKDLDVLVIGRGANGVMQVPDQTVEQVKKSCPEVHVAKTAKACEKYNELVDRPDTRVGAALHLTC